MRSTVLLAVLGFGALAAVSCSSDSGVPYATFSETGGAGFEADESLPDAASGHSPLYDLSSGADAAADSRGSTFAVAEDTQTGLAQISEAQADALQDPASVCAGWVAEPEGGRPPILEFVIDVTGSMADQPAYPDDPSNPASKWQEMQRVLPGVFNSLPETWAVGVSFYRKPDNGCFEPDQSVPIALLDAAQRSSITQAIEVRGPQPSTNDPDNVQGATPTLAAWRYGLSELNAWEAPAGYEASPRYIVLITDGVPTVNSDGCTYVNPITQAEYDEQVSIVQEEGSAAGVETFVVGVLGSEQTQNATYDPLYMLSRLAVAGGTEQPDGCVPTSGTVDTTADPSVLTSRGSYCHYDLSASSDFAGSLEQALLDIANSVLSCSYTVPTPADGAGPIDPALTNLIYEDGTGASYLLLQNTSESCDRGWHFTDETNTALEICGISCELVQNNPEARLTIVFGCKAGEVPVQ